jgi:hypothetical protein
MRSNLKVFIWFAVIASACLVVSGQYAAVAADGRLTETQNAVAEYHAKMWFGAFAVSAGVAVMVLTRVVYEWVHFRLLHPEEPNLYSTE